MPAPVRPKGSSSGRNTAPVTPMSERQQMALLMQMTSGNNDVGSRSPSSSSSGVRLRERNERGETPLHLAAIKGDVEQVCKLLSNRADPNAADFAGWTPLHEACNHGRYEVALRLVQSGANVNARGLDDDTPLHDAAANGHLRLARMLVERGADLRAKNVKGRTPLDVAPASMKPYLVDLSLALPPDSTSSGRLQPRSSRDDKKVTGTNTGSGGGSNTSAGGTTAGGGNISSSSTSSSSENNISNQSAKQKDDNSSSSSSTAMDVINKSSSPPEDVYEFKSGKECGGGSSDAGQDAKTGGDSASDMDVDTTNTTNNPFSVSQSNDDGSGTLSSTTTSGLFSSSSKRAFSELGDSTEENASGASSSGTSGMTGGVPTTTSSNNDDDSRRKKRKDETTKEGKTVTPRNTGMNKGQNSKQSSGNQNKSGSTSLSKGTEKKSPCSSPKPAVSDAEVDDGKTDLKVPPLKIVIPQTNSVEQETVGGRNGKNSSQRTHAALPYVVPSSNASATNTTTSSSDIEKDQQQQLTSTSISQSTTEPSATASSSSSSSSSATGSKNDDNKKETTSTSDENQAHNEPETSSSSTTTNNNTGTSTTTTTSTTGASTATTTSGGSGAATSASSAAASSSSSSSSGQAGGAAAPSTAPPAVVELHPRKRKMKQNKEAAAANAAAAAAAQQDPVEQPSEAQVHPHEQPITNCYKLYLNIRKQIGKRRRGLFPVQPKPPQGFKDYLMNRCTYVLAGSAPTTPNISYPQNLPTQMKDIFTEQEKERYRLRTQHVIEKEKLVLSVEQEILRVHGRAARALANQSLPFSVCTILRDEEVYNLITPEQEEKDRNARSRYNGRLFLSWLQDVDDKWEKIKEHMLLRHHNEAESLHAVQKMDWEWKMKELSLCDRKTTPKIEDAHVPMVHVSDDFDLLPA